MSIKSRTLKAFIVFLIATVIVSALPLYSYSGVYATTTAVVVNVTSYLNIRSTPVTGNVVGTLQPGARVTVLDSTSYSGWYKIKTGNITGYCSADYLYIESNIPSNPSSSGNSGDTAFENSIASFPDSYKYRLRELHALHPNWTFTAVNCGDWSSALSLEARNGVSLVPLTSDRAWLDLNEMGVKDSPNWVNASDEIIAYYMDPRNMLSEGNVFQFMDLHYPVGNVTINETQIAGALNGTFMSGTSRNFTIDGVNRLNPFQAFAIASQESGVNPIFLVTHVIQECGANGSSSSSGASGYYNLYNIGAYSDVNNAAMVGLNFAHYGVNPSFNTKYNIPWNTAGKSCVFGAKWIADNYVNKGQDTLYFMRFNLMMGGSYTRGSHQYMTALQSCSSESSRMYQSYKRAGIIDTAINFKIPVFTNMPGSASPYPALQGVTGYPTPTPTVTATPTNTQTPTATPTARPTATPTATPTAAPTPTLPLNEEYVADFVTRLYEITLDREPDEAGYDFWYTRLCRGTSGSAVAAGFVFCEEFDSRGLNDEEFLICIYRIYLNREPDAPGLAFWLGKLQGGTTRRAVVNGFAHSEEFTNLCYQAGVRAY